jgi:hypothetical protein
MSNDIVTRLRQRAIYRKNTMFSTKLVASDFIENEAADEITYLQAQLFMYQQHAIHAWFCKEQVCELCFNHFVIAKYGEEALENGSDD